MSNIIRFLISLIFFQSSAIAACTTIDVSSYTQQQKNLIYAITYRLVFEAGENKLPTSLNTDTGEVCFNTSLDLDSVLSDTIVTDRIDETIEITSDELEDTLRSISKSNFDGQNEKALALRALVYVLIDELNALRTWTRDLKTQVAAASSLADLKARIATLSTLNDRTLSQAKTAISNTIDNELVDE